MTAENQEWADKRIPILLQIPAAVSFVSCEPLLSGIDLHLNALIPTLGEPNPPRYERFWAIVGCESGPSRRPCDTQWVADIFEQCQAAQIPIFVKQIDIDGEVVHDAGRIALELSDYVGRPLCEEDIRQFPEGAKL